VRQIREIERGLISYSSSHDGCMLAKGRVKKGEKKGVVAGRKRGLIPVGNRATKVRMIKTNTLNVPTTTLKRKIIYIGLDVHKETIAVALAMEGQEPKFLKTISHDLHAVEKLVHELREKNKYHLKVCYEAGPTGFVLARRLLAWGVECIVVSPSKIPKGSGDQVKTDKRDAIKLARCLRAGDVKGIHLPDERDEAIRDLCRARTDAVEDLRRLKQQLKAFLLRNGYRYKGNDNWSQAHMRYLRELVMVHPAQKLILEETLQAIDLGHRRIAQLEAHMEQVVEGWRMKPLVKALQCLRGVAFIGATVYVSELGDLSRFENPRQLMAYLGLVTRENSTGQRRIQGSITKCGNGHVRMFLIEAAHHYRLPPKISKELSKRQEGQSHRVRQIAWEAQNRLHRRTWKLTHRGLITPKIVVAVARELSGFIWAICRETQQPSSVEIRAPRINKSPNEEARKFDYVLRRRKEVKVKAMS
jgi:transposase